MDCIANVNDFKEAMAYDGFFPGDIVPDEICRFSTNGRKDKSGWCIFHPDTSIGVYGCWREDFSKTWFPNNRSSMTEKERQQHQRQIEKAKEEAEKLRKIEQAKAAKKAREIWEKAVPATADNAYLKSKGLKPYGGIRQYGKALVVPVRTLDGKLHSLQFIGPDGGKRFLTGGRVQGCCAWIKGEGKTLLGEGWATAASLHMATGSSVVSCFNAGNMGPVADALLKSKPGIEIILCADNDQFKEVNVGIDKAMAVAEKHNLKLAIPQFEDMSSKPTDFDDLRRLSGVAEVKRQIDGADFPEADTWDNPIPLDNFQAESLDISCLPDALQKMVTATAAATETPLELAAGDCLAVLATAVHGKIVVSVKQGYTEPLNIWTMVLLEPGNRKTAVLMATAKPLLEWESARREEEKPRLMAIESERKSQEARLKALRNQYGRAEKDELPEIQNEILSIEREMAEVPFPTKVWCDDITPESFGIQLGRYGRMGIVSAEGGVIQTIAGRYSNGVPNMDVFLKSHAGDPIRVDRGSRDPVDIKNPASTFALSPQPDVLNDLANMKGAKGRGFWARWLYLLPQSNLGYRKLETEPIHDDISREWLNLICTLLDIEPTTDENGSIAPYHLSLEPGAYDEWLEFSKAVEVEMRENGRFEHMKDWAGKLPGAAIRIAGLFHCAKTPVQPWAENITLETMRQALDIAATLTSHAELAFDQMGADRTIKGAKKVWRWIESGCHETFTKSDCFQALRGTFQRALDIGDPLDVLEERNYIAGATIKAGPQGGRPSQMYTVNPEIVRGWV